MAADHSHMECPDPSAHEKHNKLSAQASTAALYVTDPSRGTNPRETVQRDVLDSNGKLSSSSAATSLKYAKAQDLPSFPSVGISTSSAGAAAMLAKDYKMKELWQPEDSAAGSKAALLAARKGAKLDLWEPSASKDGNSAATLAMRNKTLSPQLDRGYTPQGRNNALLAATQSQRQSRQRAGSTPSPAPALYPDQKNSAFNALNAATVSHRGSVRSPPPAVASKEGPGLESEAMQAARVQNIGKNVNPEMWGERPPVEIEIEEQKQKAALRASAVSMAKQMYEYQNRTVLGSDLTGTAGAEAAHSRQQSATSPADLKQEALRYIHLQDAARSLADERLAKIDKTGENARYREYYGYSMQPNRSRLSMRGRARRRASSEGGGANKQDDSDSDDEVQASRVRRQMSQFSSALADVDAKKQQNDRKALLAAAERNVNKSMNNMDERVFQETGKISQTKMDEWAAKARKKAQEDAEQRNEHKGKTHVGGGKFMDQAEIEAIASARLKPTLDEINDTAEKKRAHDEEMRLIREEEDRQKIHEKQDKQAKKEEQKQIKSEQKAEKQREKEERKAAESERKTAESRRKAAEQAEKEDKRKSVEEQQPAEGKRKSLLSRLASKRKSRDVKKDEMPDATEGTAAAAGTAGAVAVAAPESEEKETDPSHTEGTTAEVPAIVEPKDSTEEIRPTTAESRPALAPIRSNETHNGSHTDAVPSPKLERKPDLERHISKIESSSGSSLSDYDTDKEEDKLHKDVPVAAAGASGAAVAAAVPGNDEDHAKAVAERVVSAPADDMVSSTAKGSTADGLSKQGSTPAATSTSSATPATGAAAPIVKTGPGSTSTDEPRQSTASSRPSEEKEPKGFRGFFSKLRSKSKGDNKLRSEPADVEKVAPTVTGTAAAPKEPVTDKSASEPTATTDASATAPTAAHVGTDGAIGSSTLPDVNKAARSVSPSSFRRRNSGSSLGDVSSLSSSGLEEDDLVQGRSGRMARAMKVGTGKDKGKAKEVDAASPKKNLLAKDPVVSGDESDQFEEARDHFDEGLAPQPAFGGQAKSQSPARETRFHEEV